MAKTKTSKQKKPPRVFNHLVETLTSARAVIAVCGAYVNAVKVSDRPELVKCRLCRMTVAAKVFNEQREASK